MKVSVLGAGAIGSMFGGLIKHHDPAIDVQFIGRGAHGQAILDTGHVVLEGHWGVHRVPVRFSTSVESLAGSDFVLFTVKTQDTEKAAASLVPYLGAARLISIQNGVSNAAILSKFIPEEQLVMGISATNMAILKPGAVCLQRDGATLVGAPSGSGSTPAVEAGMNLLKKSHMKIAAHANVLGAQYTKLAINALGYASVLSNSDFLSEAVLCKAWRQAVGIPILDECRAVFRRRGIELAGIPGSPSVWFFRLLLWFLNRRIGFLGTLYLRVLHRQRIVWSLQQDLLRRKETEIDFVNGTIVRLARECGMEAPRNAKVVELVHELEARGDGSFFTRDEVIRQFRKI